MTVSSASHFWNNVRGTFFLAEGWCGQIMKDSIIMAWPSECFREYFKIKIYWENKKECGKRSDQDDDDEEEEGRSIGENKPIRSR